MKILCIREWGGLDSGKQVVPFCLRDVENPISWAHSAGISINASTVTRKQMAISINSISCEIVFFEIGEK